MFIRRVTFILLFDDSDESDSRKMIMIVILKIPLI